jgi:DNA-directed RNA polymerase subunit RPC12/RpoP
MTYQCFACHRTVTLQQDYDPFYQYLICPQCHPQYSMPQLYELFETERCRDTDGVSRPEPGRVEPPGILYTDEFAVDEADPSPDAATVLLVHIRRWDTADDVDAWATFAEAFDMTLDQMLEAHPDLVKDDAYDADEIQAYRDQLAVQVDEACRRLDPDLTSDSGANRAP